MSFHSMRRVTDAAASWNPYYCGIWWYERYGPRLICMYWLPVVKQWRSPAFFVWCTVSSTAESFSYPWFFRYGHHHRHDHNGSLSLLQIIIFCERTHHVFGQARLFRSNQTLSLWIEMTMRTNLEILGLYFRKYLTSTVVQPVDVLWTKLSRALLASRHVINLNLTSWESDI